MEVLYLLMVLSFFMALCGLTAFFWANSDGQFEDLVRPAEELLRNAEDLLPKA